MGFETFLAIAGLVASVGGSLYSAQQQNEMAEYNERVELQAAEMEKDKANYDARMHNQEVRRILATQRSLFGKSGISSETGSPLLVMSDSIKQGAMDALAIRYGGDVAAAKHKSAANLYRMEGQNAKSAGIIKAGTSLLSGAGEIYKTYK